MTVYEPSSGKKPAPFDLLKYVKRNYQLLLMITPGILVLIFFKIGPVAGMVIALQDFNAFRGLFGSDFVGLAQFQRILGDPYMLTLVRNTVLLAFLTILCSFPVPVLFALFLNEVRLKPLKGVVQSFSFLPYFISSAVMVSILYTMLSPSDGLVNYVIEYFGGEPVSFMSDPRWFRPLYVILHIWQNFGYSAIVYLAAIVAIDPALYEAADIDGATRWQKMKSITLPGIAGSIVVMLIISVGNIFTVDLDRILLMYNPRVYETADVIQTYVYRIAFGSTGFPDYSYGTAVNVLKSLIAFVMVIMTNKIATKYSEMRLF